MENSEFPYLPETKDVYYFVRYIVRQILELHTRRALELLRSIKINPELMDENPELYEKLDKEFWEYQRTAYDVISESYAVLDEIIRLVKAFHEYKAREYGRELINKCKKLGENLLWLLNWYREIHVVFGENLLTPKLEYPVYYLEDYLYLVYVGWNGIITLVSSILHT